MKTCLTIVHAQNFDPEIAKLCSRIVIDDVTGKMYMFSSEGDYVLLSNKGRGTYAATIDVLSNSDVKKTDILNSEDIAKGDLIQDINGDVYAVTDKTGTTVTVGGVLFNLKGDKGDQGEKGDPGEKGDTGAAFAVSKVYASIAEMNAGYHTDGLPIGAFVVIGSNVDDPDNAKLYVKGPLDYDYLTDMSGAKGIQGPKGETGAPAGFGTVTATSDNTSSDTPTVTVSATGPNTAKDIAFAFTGLKGKKGDQGEQGEPGPEGTPGVAAGFGTPTATVDDNTGTPSVVVTATGDDTSKVFNFDFRNLKGEKGDTGEVNVDNDTIETSTDGKIRVKDKSITHAKIADGVLPNIIAPLNVATNESPRITDTSSNSSELAIGNSAHVETTVYHSGIAIGNNAAATDESIGIGYAARAQASCIAIGDWSICASPDTISTNGSGATALGYEATNYDTDGTPITAQREAGHCILSVGNRYAHASSGSHAVYKSRIINVDEPTEPDNAATKNYVDNLTLEVEEI